MSSLPIYCEFGHDPSRAPKEGVCANCKLYDAFAHVVNCRTPESGLPHEESHEEYETKFRDDEPSPSEGNLNKSELEYLEVLQNGIVEILDLLDRLEGWREFGQTGNPGVANDMFKELKRITESLNMDLHAHDTIIPTTQHAYVPKLSFEQSMLQVPDWESTGVTIDKVGEENVEEYSPVEATIDEESAAEAPGGGGADRIDEEEAAEDEEKQLLEDTDTFKDPSPNNK